MPCWPVSLWGILCLCPHLAIGVLELQVHTTASGFCVSIGDPNKVHMLSWEGLCSLTNSLDQWLCCQCHLLKIFFSMCCLLVLILYHKMQADFCRISQHSKVGMTKQQRSPSTLDTGLSLKLRLECAAVSWGAQSFENPRSREVNSGTI